MTKDLPFVRACALLLTLVVSQLLLASCSSGGGDTQNTQPAHSPTPAEGGGTQSVAANSASPTPDNGKAVTNVNGAVAGVITPTPMPDFKCGTPTASVAPSQSKAYRLATNLVNAMRRVQTFQATMQVTTCLEQVRETYDVQGEVRYKGSDEPEAVLIQYTGDRKNRMRLLNETVEFYQPRLNQVTRMAVRTARSRYFRSYYTRYEPRMKNAARAYLGDEQVGGARTAILKLTPRQPDRFKTVYVWVVYETWVPVKVLLVENKQTTTIQFSNTKLNGPLDDAAFQLNLPAGTKVIEQ